jgi:hypothetical protein
MMLLITTVILAICYDDTALTGNITHNCSDFDVSHTTVLILVADHALTVCQHHDYTHDEDGPRLLATDPPLIVLGAWCVVMRRGE